MEEITAESILSGKLVPRLIFPMRAAEDYCVDRLEVEV
jgi:hypothetical protein